MGKATKGSYYANGRRKQPTTKAERDAKAALNKRVPPNDVVQARHNLWNSANIREGKAAHDVYDAIGQLHALDFLDGHGYTPEELRDAGRRYASLYWRRNADKAPKGQKLELGDRAEPNLDDTHADIAFENMAEALRFMRFERDVLELVTVDYWFKDDIAPFAFRLVTTELLKRKRLPPVVEFEGPNDRAFLAALIRALCAVHESTIKPHLRRAA